MKVSIEFDAAEIALLKRSLMHLYADAGADLSDEEDVEELTSKLVFWERHAKWGGSATEGRGN